MKKLFIIILFTFSQAAICQSNILNTPNSHIQEYLKKSQNQKIGGAISLALGGIMYPVARNASKQATLEDLFKGTGESIACAGFIVMGVLELIGSVRNKHRAKLLINNEKSSRAFKSRDQWHLGIAVAL